MDSLSIPRDQQIKKGDIPDSVNFLSLSHVYDQEIIEGVIPNSVKTISIPPTFNQEVNNEIIDINTKIIYDGTSSATKMATYKRFMKAGYKYISFIEQINYTDDIITSSNHAIYEDFVYKITRKDIYGINVKIKLKLVESNLKSARKR